MKKINTKNVPVLSSSRFVRSKNKQMVSKTMRKMNNRGMLNKYRKM